ncbi:MAG TPA: Trm112 family protein [Candidatus Polarisedimenticolaceae bacterium]|nr:Trm112 family protein [Candidatus Polarisedimenticolaceae bacterium]
MPIDRRLLEILRCPACHGEIRPVDDDSGLECRSCGRIYPIRDGIPIMLVEEASPPTRDDSETTGSRT